MRTDDLINGIAAAAGINSVSMRGAATLAFIGSAAATAVIFVVTLGMRHDIAQAIETYRFLFKFAFVVALGVPASVVAMRLGRPGAVIGPWGWALALAPSLLVLGVLMELVAVPQILWTAKLLGANWRECVTFIAMLSIAPLAFILLALRHAAPTNGRVAGAIAGMVAASVAAGLFASHCTDDSPLFVATWYPIAIGIVALVGSLIGARVLRW